MLLTNPADMDSASYRCAVLWMEGRLKTSEIAHRLGWDASKVRNFATRNFSPPRQRMSMEDRQAVLTTLLAYRHEHGWKGSTYDRNFVAKKLTTLPVKMMPKAEELPPVDTSKRGWRKEMRRREEAAIEKRNEEIRRAAYVSQYGGAPRQMPDERGRIPDSLEWLRIKGLLSERAANDSEEEVKRVAVSGYRRHKAGEMLRRYSDGSKLSALSGTDYESFIMGSGSGAPLTLSEYRLFCINTMIHIQSWMPETEFKVLDAVVCRDEAPWEGAKAGKRQIIFMRLHRGLDVVAVHEGLMTRKEFKDVWLDELPTDDAPTRSEARYQADRAAEMFRSARNG